MHDAKHMHDAKRMHNAKHMHIAYSHMDATKTNTH